jgi:hypothetical protein
MTDEEKRNDAIDRLGGESRLAKLEQRIQHLEGLLQEIHLRPGVKLNLTMSHLSWFDGTIYSATPPVLGDVVLEAIGEDWAVVRDTASGTTYCAIEPGIHTSLRACL